MGTDNNLQILQQPESAVLFNDVCLIIDQARRHVATYVNVEACLMNWHVGKRIKEDVLYNQRAEYGKQILKNLSVKLTERYGTGWGTEKLKHCVRSAYLFSEDDIMYAARTQLTWTHLRSLMSLKDSLERQFYMEMCRIEHWDTRTLDEKIDSQLYQRTAISQRPEEVIRRELKELREEDTLNPDIVFRSTYFLDMLGVARCFLRERP